MWTLINASPDVTAQIRGCEDLQPEAGELRGTPISEILLTNADLDHVLGLFCLREGRKLQVHAPQTVRDTLDAGLNLTPMMNAFCGIAWHEPPAVNFGPIEREDGRRSALEYRALKLPGKPPLFATKERTDGTHSVAYQIVDRDTGGCLLVAPDVAACTETLMQAMRESDAVIFDGTFWSEDELLRLKPGSRTATQMGHVTMANTSLSILRSLQARHKVYTHINNTNPVLSPASPERALVEAAGIVIGRDGLEFVV